MSKKTVSGKYIEKLRNIGIIAHIDAGKTTLTERILYYSHKIHRMGEVHEGTATMDFMPEEQERGITISSACTTCQWGDKMVNIIDTPGHVDFTIEVERSLRVLDGAIGVFCAVGGVEPQSETVWRQSEKFRVPKLAFINKMDRPGADFSAVLVSMREKLGARPVAVQCPLGQGPEFSGIADCLTMERLVFDADTKGEQVTRQPLSEAEKALVEPWREKLLEALSDEDDALMELYLSGEVVPIPALHAALRKATLAMRLTPVFCGSALRNIGVQPLLDGVAAYLPSPLDAVWAVGANPRAKERITLTPSPDAPFAALAFKVSMENGRRLVLMRVYSGKIAPGEAVYNVTRDKEERIARLFRLHAEHKERLDQALAGEIVAVAGLKEARTGDTLTVPGYQVLLERIAEYQPVISLALEPKNAADGDRLNEALEKCSIEDPTLFLEIDQDTGQRLLSGMGELHLEVVLERLKREYNVEPRVGRPEVAYQETIAGSAVQSAEFYRELGEKMHYGWVELSVSPLPRDKGREIVFELDVSLWNENYIEAVHQGVSDGLQSGALKGYPVRDVRVAVREMRRKEGESSPPGYHMAAASALKKALSEANPVLLEPIMWVEVTAPEDFLGDAMGLLGSKGAKVENLFDRAGQKTIQALTPMRQLFGFSTALRSATQGRAGITIRFARFDVLG